MGRSHRVYRYSEGLVPPHPHQALNTTGAGNNLTLAWPTSHLNWGVLDILELHVRVYISWLVLKGPSQGLEFRVLLEVLLLLLRRGIFILKIIGLVDDVRNNLKEQLSGWASQVKENQIYGSHTSLYWTKGMYTKYFNLIVCLMSFSQMVAQGHDALCYGWIPSYTRHSLMHSCISKIQLNTLRIQINYSSGWI